MSEVVSNVEYNEEQDIQEVDISGIDLSGLELDGMVESFISVDTENLEDIKFNKTEFQKGVKSVSEVCGMITALANAGVSPTDALSYVMNERNTQANIKLTEMVNEADIEKCKYGQILTEKTQL